jgi:hypothetical protein
MMEFDKNGIPFIPLPTSYQNLRLTLPLYADGPAIIKINNDPSVYMNLAGPPFPYTDQAWEDWWAKISKVAADYLAEVSEVQEGKRKWVGSGSPFMVIRQIDEDGIGEGMFIGDIGIRKRGFLLIKDNEARMQAQDENEGYEAGDPRCQWEIGCECLLSISACCY